jgi:uncharacterized protein (TIGR03000 family)
MLRTLRTGLLVPAVVAVLLWAAGPALAWGPGGGFHGGFGGYAGGWHGGGYGGWGHGYGGGGYALGLGYYGGYPYSYGGYSGYPYSYGSYGAYPSYYGNAYLGSYYTPAYSYPQVQAWTNPNDSGYMGPTTTYTGKPAFTNPNDSGYMGPTIASTTSTTSPDTLVRLRVEVPADAQVWVAGAQTKQTGTVREFVSPPVTPGQDYNYDVRATWTDETGQVVDQTKQVPVHAGSQVLVNFLAPAATE